MWFLSFLAVIVPSATVVIDPGHGGKQPGARAGKGRYEATLTLDVSKNLQKELEKRGHTVFLTRTDDTFVSLGARARFANSKNADVMISIHANDAGSRTASGIETYFLSTQASDAEAQALAERENDDSDEVGDDREVLGSVLSDLKRSNATIESELLANRVHGSVVRSTNAKSRGIRRAPLAVLKRTEMAAILVEIGFMTHPTEGAQLWTTPYQTQIALGLANGVDRFLSDFATGEVPELPPPSDVPLISLTNRAKRSANSPMTKVILVKKKGGRPSVVMKTRIVKARPGKTVVAKTRVATPQVKKKKLSRR